MPDSDNLNGLFLTPDSIDKPARLADDFPDTRIAEFGHDEPLHGKREGQRSIRLSRAYRAIYEINRDGEIEFVTIEEVSKHDY